jgi:hypothetical protein
MEGRPTIQAEQGRRLDVALVGVEPESSETRVRASAVSQTPSGRGRFQFAAPLRAYIAQLCQVVSAADPLPQREI